MSYLHRHWTGGLPLGRAFWLNFVGLNLLVSSASELVVDWTRPLYLTPFQVLVAIGLALALGIPVFVWQFVGTWRAAAGHVRRTGRWLWARLGQAALVVALAGSLGAFVQLGLLARELVLIGLGLDELATVELRVEDDFALQINGYITYDLPDRVRVALQENGGIGVIELNSPGGRIGPARELRDVIAAAGLPTYSRFGCASACILPFMAGSERILHEGAQLGFHQYDLPYIEPIWKAEEQDFDRDYLLSRGVSPAFLDRAFDAAPSEIWSPPLAVLAREGVVTHVLDEDGISEADAYCRLNGCGPGQVR